tara:strand:- start:276 stop:1178 length:903 start_codon:yes stop_codon:yes gene_type:complete
MSLKIINEIEKEFKYQINIFKKLDISELIKKIITIKGNIYLCGVGKSGNISIHFCDLMKSLSYKCFYLNVLNLLHGDSGVIKENDMIIMFSNSGSTQELINVIPILKKKKAYIIGICCKKESLFNNTCNMIINLPHNTEISGNIDKIPTNSVMSFIIFINLLISILKQYENVEEYKLNHLSGNIGKEYLLIKDKMITDFPKIIFDKEEELVNILLLMTNKGIGCCIFVDKNDNMIGILTDGDVRRLLIKNSNLKTIKLDNINRKYIYETDENKFVSQVIKINSLPIVKNNKPIGLLTVNY